MSNLIRICGLAVRWFTKFNSAGDSAVELIGGTTRENSLEKPELEVALVAGPYYSCRRSSALNLTKAPAFSAVAPD